MTTLFHVILHWNNDISKKKILGSDEDDTRSSPLLVRFHLAVLMLIWWGLFMSHYILLRSMHLNISPHSKCFMSIVRVGHLSKSIFFWLSCPLHSQHHPIIMSFNNVISFRCAYLSTHLLSYNNTYIPFVPSCQHHRSLQLILYTKSEYCLKLVKVTGTHIMTKILFFKGCIF